MNPFSDHNLLSRFTQVACRVNTLIVCGSNCSVHEKEGSLVHYGSHNDFLFIIPVACSDEGRFMHCNVASCVYLFKAVDVRCGCYRLSPGKNKSYTKKVNVIKM